MLKKIVILAIVALSAVFSSTIVLYGQESKGQINLGQHKKDIKVGLVLCGGGAKGVSHIGVIKRLEELQIKPDLIVGTSMGALVGGLYAMGYDSKQMDSIVTTADWDHLLSDNVKRSDVGFSKKQADDMFFLNIPFYSLKKGGVERAQKEPKEINLLKALPGGFVSGKNVLNLLNGLAIGYQDSMSFNKLPIPFACIATDLATGDEVVLDHGHLPPAMRASMAIPGFFAPVTIDGKVLVDGGVVNNFPVDVARKMGADIIIGVDVQTDLADASELKSIDAVLLQLIGLLGNEKFNENKQNVDIYMHPDVSKYGTLSFTAEAVDSLLVNGYKAALEREDVLVALSKLLGEKYGPEYNKKMKNSYNYLFKVDKIELNGVDAVDRNWLLKSAGLEEGTEISGEQIDRAISIFNGTQAFSQVTFSLEKQPFTTDSADSYILSFNFEKGAPSMVSIGARYDSEEAAAMLLRIGIHQYTFQGSRAELTARMSFNPYIKLGYSYVFRTFPRLEINYMFGKKDVNIYSDKEAKNNINFIYNGIEADLANIKYMRNFYGRSGVRLDIYNFTRFLNKEGAVPSLKARSYLSLFAEGIMDNRDEKYFPTRGSYLKADASYAILGFHSGFQSFTSFMLSFSTNVTLGRGFVLTPHIYSRINIRNKHELPFYNFVGGSEAGRYVPHQIPFIGINYANALDNAVTVLRTDLRKQFSKKHYVSLMANYLRNGTSADKMISTDYKGFWGFGLQYAYNAKVGPLSFNLHWSDYNKKKVGVYVSLGYFF